MSPCPKGVAKPFIFLRLQSWHGNLRHMLENASPANLNSYGCKRCQVYTANGVFGTGLSSVSEGLLQALGLIEALPQDVHLP